MRFFCQSAVRIVKWDRIYGSRFKSGGCEDSSNRAPSQPAPILAILWTCSPRIGPNPGFPGSDPANRDQPPVIRLSRMGRSAIGKEPLGVRIGAMPGPFALTDPGLPQPVQAKPRQIEQIPVALSIGEETGIARVIGHEILQQFGPHLIGPLAD